ncbi:transpeptidase-transglycosylase [Psychroflexus gondwanensis]|uniref:transglycosylase domain-containing protein n=1 Tax=Psychroflexus gondwanensis TaxID=251 RepID=UPI0011BE9218|nr:transglycosylase domain-containing protein [Psychroflexus gondwanensis]TXE21028.1 transpeptidase-transglycosylase [Psychroflexus gondwanensis]
MTKSKKKKNNSFFRLFLWGMTILIGSFFIFFGSIYIGLWGKVQTKSDLQNIKQSEATEILDHKGEVIDKFYKYNRQSISYSAFPKHLVEALVATEDARFYEHDGVDNYSLLRVFFKTILSGDKSSGGGSTLTQQLVKNIYGRKSYGFFSLPVNKLKESIIAKRIENVYSKKEILELYLNTVPFSGNTYGIESAANQFFDKTTSDLSVPESATLVGTLKANHSYNPRLFPERSQLRRDVVLSQMQKYGYLTSEKASSAMSESIQLKLSKRNTFQRQFFVDLIKSEVEGILDSINSKNDYKYSIEEDGLKIHTTLDLDQQKLLEASVKKHIGNLQPQFEAEYSTDLPWKNKALLLKIAENTKVYKRLKRSKISKDQLLDSLQKKRPIEVLKNGEYTVLQLSTLDSISYSLKQINAASLSVNPKTGAILAYVGGVDYRTSKFDIIKNSRRQVGSTFKPIVYASALKAGIKPCDYFSAKEITYTNFKDWKPENSSHKEKDPYLNFSMKHALTHSLNTVSVKVLEKAGIENTITLAKSMGVTSNMVSEPSLALGVAELNMKELAKVYSSIANQSKVPEIHFITKITSKTGEVIAEFTPAQPKSSELEVEQNRILLAILENVVDEGTASRLRTTFRLRQDLAGKTGTTQGNKDGWFAAITPKLVNITWVGHNNQSINFKTTRLGQGANSALPIFGTMYQQMVKEDRFNEITRAKFPSLSENQREALNCNGIKRDGFFKRLFTKDETEKNFDDETEKEDKKEGFFSRLFSSKKK